MKEVVVALSGASGIKYGIRLLEILKILNIKTHFIITNSAKNVLKKETGFKLRDIYSIPTFNYSNYSFENILASGSYISRKDISMIIIPCSMNTIGKIANSISDNLVTRSASVFLKENKKILFVIRETPLSYIHLKNMLNISLSGGIIFPASPFFYNNPKTINEIIDDLIFRILNVINIKIPLKYQKEYIFKKHDNIYEREG